MPKKRWHVYLTRDAHGRLVAGITNEIERINAVYVQACRDRTDALDKGRRLKRLARAEKLKLVAQAQRVRGREELPGKLYQVRNESFACANCGAAVEPTEHDSPRNHCPFCLYSQHVDILPGDRKNPCRGLLKPVGVESSGRKGYVIVYACERCGERTRAKAALKSTVQPDDFAQIVELSRAALKKSKLLF